jgi:hypothetical protein
MYDAYYIVVTEFSDHTIFKLKSVYIGFIYKTIIFPLFIIRLTVFPDKALTPTIIIYILFYVLMFIDYSFFLYSCSHIQLLTNIYCSSFSFISYFFFLSTV